MSVIGPRPLLVEYLPYYTKEEHHRHDVRPGLDRKEVELAVIMVENVCVKYPEGSNGTTQLRLDKDCYIPRLFTLTEDCLEYLEYLNDEVDIYDTSAGLNASIQYQIDANYLEDGWRSYMAKAVRDKFGKPTIAIGNIRDPKIANDILARRRRTSV